MPEFLQNIINRVKEWWQKFSVRQKAMMISAVAVVVVAMAILAYVVTRPTYITLVTADSATAATTIGELLDGESIEYKNSDDGMTFYVKSEDKATATILLGTNDIPSDGYSIDDVLDGSFSTTEADKLKKYQLYLEEKYADTLEELSNVSSASVNLSIPDDDGTLIANEQDSYAAITLELSGTMSSDEAGSIAKWIATSLGNDDTANITIVDTDGNTLFSGGDEATAAGIASSNNSVKEQAESAVVEKVKNILSSSGNGNAIFDNVDIGVNLDMDFADEQVTDYHYYVDDDQTQGYLDSRSEKTSDSTNGVAGTPGTDSNDDTTYLIEDSDYSTSSTSDITEDYLPSETITITNKAAGEIEYETSNISVVAYNYVIYNEDELEADGTLDDMTFDEFKAQNSDQVKTEVDEDLYTAVSQATGIPVANISILTYDVPMFEYSTSSRDLMDYLQIILAVLIFAMLGFVVYRTLKKDEEEETEEEVSVETLLEAQEENLEDIGFSEKSEARILIEKFVDENPDAVAALLRNWLNEDWGQ